MYYLGLDIGSLSCDAVLLDAEANTVAWTVVPTGARNIESITRAREVVLTEARVDPQDLTAVVATGYGRARVKDKLAAVTEITCHTRGITHQLPGTELLVDIGGQDSKAILLDPAGKVAEFTMNDKCAAGTGRFLEAMARALEVDLEFLGGLDVEATGDLTLSSMCTVFAESEVVSLIAEGTPRAEIVKGLNRAIATRPRSLVKRVERDPKGRRMAMSGGVARNPGVVRALSEAIGCEITTPTTPTPSAPWGRPHRPGPRQSPTTGLNRQPG